MAGDKDNKTSITGMQRAAIIITSLGLESAATVFRGLSEEEMEELTAAITDLKSIPDEIRQQTLSEFLEQMRNGVAAAELVNLQSLLEKTVGKERAEVLMSKIQTARDGKVFEALNQLDPKQIVAMLQQERPQTLALILCHLNPKRGAEILSSFDPEFQAQVIVCVGRMDRISPEIVAKVDAIVRKKLSGMQGRLRITGGPKTIAQMLNHIDRSTEKQIFESLNRKDEALLQDVKRLMLLFEDLVALDDKAVQQVLREIDMNDLAMALKGAPAELKKLIQRNLSKRAAERLVEEAELMGPKPRSDVDAAQQRIVAVVRRLEEEGKISLGARAGGNDELVA
jgi:flagellar motor switch protein FliG